MLQTKSKPHKYLSMVGYSIIHLLTWAFYVCGFSIKMRNCTILILWHLVADFLPFFCTSYTLVQAAEAKVHYCYFSCIFMFVCLFLIAESQYVCTLSSQIHLLLSVQVISVFGKERTCIIPFSYKIHLSMVHSIGSILSSSEIHLSLPWLFYSNQIKSCSILWTQPMWWQTSMVKR